MEDTGRIKQPISAIARRILFERAFEQQVHDELGLVAQIDRAHLVMLVEAGIIPRETTVPLLATMSQLRENSRPIEGRSPTRGLFLAYEDYLIESHGIKIGGVLQTARSRNDLNATLLRLRLREPLLRLWREILRLQAVLLRRAARYARAVMPAYTHYQAAVPTTYGHYLAAIAQAVSRNLSAILGVRETLQVSPLGAGAVAGTTFRIEPERTAFLLGFESSSSNSIDAVASRDFVLSLLAALAIYCVTLSRLAEDLLLWTSSEFNFLELPDSLVGSSSAMPQKRNAFLLEHIQGRSAALLGAFASSIMATHGAPYTNSIAVGTEAVGSVWKAMQDALDLTKLARLVVAGARPNFRRMNTRAAETFTNATETAHRLVADCGFDFRTAHNLVGRAVVLELDAGQRQLGERALAYLDEQGAILPAGFPRVDAIARNAEHGGGPGVNSLTACLNDLRNAWRHCTSQRAKQIERWRRSDQILDGIVKRMCRSCGGAKAVFFFCTNQETDPVAGHVFQSVQRLFPLREIELSVDGNPVQIHRDALGDEFWFVRTAQIVNENYELYLPLLRRYFADADFAGVVNWHSSQKSSTGVFTVHTMGDVPSGIFGRAHPTCTRNLLMALDANRRRLHLDHWKTYMEATHWPVGGGKNRPELMNEFRVPLVDVEIGSCEANWRNPVAAEVVASALVQVFKKRVDGLRSFVCVGGIHLDPACSDAVLSDNESVAVTHILPNSGLNAGMYHEEHGQQKLRSCIASVDGGVDAILQHHSLKGRHKGNVNLLATQLNLSVIDHRSFHQRTP